MARSFIIIWCVAYIYVELVLGQEIRGPGEVCNSRNTMLSILNEVGLSEREDGNTSELDGNVSSMKDIISKLIQHVDANSKTEPENSLEISQSIRAQVRSLKACLPAEHGANPKEMKHSLPFNPQGVAIRDDQLYFPSPQSPDIHVYNSEPFAHNRTITVIGMKNPCDIVVSDNVLYVSELEDELIHRIQLPEESVSNWTVDGIGLTLSIAKNGNVIVASWEPDKIFEYTSVGNLVREIVVNRFDANMVGLQHAIQMDGDKFLVCHAVTAHHRVCMIDNTGRVIKCYGGNEGSGIEHLNGPVYLAIDRIGFILVVDHLNNSIVRLNSSLEYINETIGIQQPFRILLDEERGRLYVLEINIRNLTVLYTHRGLL